MTTEQKLKITTEALEAIATRGDQCGVIPCPQDYNYYVWPMKETARFALNRIENDVVDAEAEPTPHVIQTVGDPGGFQFTRVLDRAVCERDLERSDGTIIWEGRVDENT